MQCSTRSMNRAIVLVLGGLLAVPAVAQKAKKADPDEVKARALFADAQKSYDLGEFDQALPQYAEAYKLKPLPGFLFNIAQCHRQLGNFKEAAFFYGRFIDNSKPDAPNVELARQLLDDSNKQALAKAEAAAKKERDDEEARKAAAEKEKKPDAPLAATLVPADLPPSPPPLVVEEATPVYQKGWFWGVVGGGAAVVAGGIVAGVLLSRQGPKNVTTLGDIDWRGQL